MSDFPPEVEALYQKLNKEAEASGYHLNPDVEFTKGLVQGLIKNEKKYGYQACPCRRAVYDRKKDLDIICPCDYRDPDLNEYDMCYCGLYVTAKVLKGKNKCSQYRKEGHQRKKGTSSRTRKPRHRIYPSPSGAAKCAAISARVRKLPTSARYAKFQKIDSKGSCRRQKS